MKLLPSFSSFLALHLKLAKDRINTILCNENMEPNHNVLMSAGTLSLYQFDTK